MNDTYAHNELLLLLLLSPVRCFARGRHEWLYLIRKHLKGDRMNACVLHKRARVRVRVCVCLRDTLAGS